jgi:hypothetical protein
VVLITPSTLECRYGEAKTLKGHKGAIQSVSFSPMAKSWLLAVVTKHQTLGTQDGKEIKTLNGIAIGFAALVSARWQNPGFWQC